MITNEHVRDYLFSLEEELPQYLSNLEKEALRKNVPIIRRDVQSLLKYLLRKEKPEATPPFLDIQAL